MPKALALLLLFATGAGAAKPKGKAPIPKRAPAEQISVTFAGDVTLGYHYEEYVDEQLKLGRSLDELMAHGFARVKARAKEGDLFVVNLECPFTTRGEKIPKNFNFRARPELVGALAAGGVDVVSLANNHLMDYGPEGLADTVTALDEAGIVHFGAGRSLAHARTAAVVERKGITLAFLGYFFLGDRNIEPPEVIATENTPGVAGHPSDVAAMQRMVQEDIAQAKTRAQLVIPYFHWGREGRRVVEPYQVQLAHAAIDAGAAAVIGSHPHVLQGMELYRGAPILYSLGNFVFGGNWDPKDKQTALVRLHFSSAGFLSARVSPAKSDRYPEVPLQPYLVEGDEAAAVLQRLANDSADFAQPLPGLPRPHARDAGG